MGNQLSWKPVDVLQKGHPLSALGHWAGWRMDMDGQVENCPAQEHLQTLYFLFESCLIYPHRQSEKVAKQD